MEEDNVIRIRLSTILLILAIIAIVVMGIFMYKFYNEKVKADNKSTELQAQVDDLNGKVSDLQEKINTMQTASNPTTNEAENNNNIINATTNSTNIYDGQSFVGYYQLLNNNYFSVSKYDSTKNTTLDLEIQLLSDGTAKVAYHLVDNGHVSSNQYNATYTVDKVDEMEIDGDPYRILKLTYTSDEAKNDDVISNISTDITYNPATNPSDGTQAFPKSLVMRNGADNLIPYMVNSSEIKYLK